MIDVHAHAEALVHALEARGLRVYDGGAGYRLDGAVETPTAPYVVVYMDGGIRSSESLVASSEERAEFDCEVWSVGKSPRSARSVRSDVLALVGTEIVVAGRGAVVRSVFSDPTRPDRDDPRTALWQGRDGLTLVSLQA